MAKHLAATSPSSNKAKRKQLEKRRARAVEPASRAEREARERAEREAQAVAALQAGRGARRPETVMAALLAGERVALPHGSRLAALARALGDAHDVKSNEAAGVAAPARDVVAALRRVVAAAGVEALLRAASPDKTATALLGLARHHTRWLREPEGFAARSHNPWRRVAELARHLLCRWPVPALFDAAWFEGVPRHQDWFVHLGAGNNLRTAPGLPIVLTKRMAHHALLAPSSLSIPAALRWGQVLGLGGDERVARGVVGTRLRERFEHDEFWQTVLRFFTAHPMLDPARYGSIVDFVHQARFVTEPGALRPAQPNLTMSGRSPDALVRQVDAWHRALGRLRVAVRRGGNTIWARHPSMLDWAREEGHGPDRVRVDIVELLSFADLIDEGRRMHHCVATYASSCASGRVSIWSLRRTDRDGPRHLLTIEVQNPTGTIVQAGGPCNAPPGPRGWFYLQRWAQEQRLKLAAWVRPA